MPRESRTASGQTSAKALLRAALLGLSGGLLLGGVFLLSLGLLSRLAPRPCDDFSEEECLFQQEAQKEMGRVQGMSGAALLALGVAGAALLIRRKSDTEPGKSDGPAL